MYKKRFIYYIRRSRGGIQGKRQFQNNIGNLHAWIIFYYFFVVDYLNFEVHNINI